MSKIPSITYHHKAWLAKAYLKVGVTVLAGLIGQTALAACPAVLLLSELVRVNQTTDVDGNTIYFCKSSPINDLNLKFTITQENLVIGGSQAISKNSASSSKTIQGFPSNLEINLGSFDLSATNLKPGTLIAAFPQNPTPSTPPDLFNFYTRRTTDVDNSTKSQAACGAPQTGDYKFIETYLKNNPGAFNITSGSSSINSNPSKGFLQFSNVKLLSSTSPASPLLADLYLYHMNNITGQYYTRDRSGGSYVYCWFGVRAELEIKPSNSNADLQYSGEYKLNIGVNTK